jgi:hypothetical protein
VQVTTRQLTVLIAAITILSAGLAWWLQRYELQALHGEVRDYLRKQDQFKQWQADNEAG